MTAERDFSHLETIAARMVSAGRGILAADESDRTIAKRFEAIGVASSEASRRDWRETLFRAEEAMRERISGVILFDETLRQSSEDGTPLAELIAKTGALVGIKVDKGVSPLGLHPREPITHGLDGLRERLEEYRSLGAVFAKWRAVLKIGDELPSRAAIAANAEALSRYAALCQEAGLVPIVEPEILMDGDHDISRCFDATSEVLRAVYESLALHGVHLAGTVLKPNMVVSGADCFQRAGVEEAAEKTLSCLAACVPRSVGGVAFLSGGQSEEEATAHLNAINAMKRSDAHPWPLTFSYGRALQTTSLRLWGGRADNRAAAQEAFSHRAKMNGLAQMGAWSARMEESAS